MNNRTPPASERPVQFGIGSECGPCSGELPPARRLTGKKSAPLKYVALGILALAVGLSHSARAASTDTWVGATGTNWATSTNWSYSSGSGPIASGDSLVFTSTNNAGSNILGDSLTSASFNVAGITFNAGAVAYTMTGNTFALTGNITNNSANLETINNSSIAIATSESINAAVGAITIGSAITSGTVVLTGTGAVTLGGADTLSALTLGASVANTNVNTDTAFTGEFDTTLNLNASQTVGNITVGDGAQVINVGANDTITAGTIAGITTSSDRFTALNINLGSGASMTTNSLNTSGLLVLGSQFNILTLNGNDFAANSTNAAGGSIVAATYTASTSTSLGTASQNTTVGGNVTLAGSVTTNSLRFGASSSCTITEASGQTLSLNGASNGSGSVLMSSTDGAVVDTITGGTLQGSSNRGYSFLNYDTTSGANLVINSNINNYPGSGNGVAASTFVEVAGGGLVTLGGTNFINGQIYVDSSTLSAASDSNLGAVSGTVGLLTATNGSTTVILNTAVSNTSGIAVGDVLLGQIISNIAVGSGTTTVTLASAYTGTTISSGTTTVGYVGGGSINLNGGTLQATSGFTLGETNNTGSGSTGLSTTIRNRNIGLGTQGGLFDVTGANVLTVPGVISGSGTLTKVDTGALALAGSNTYTGATLINAGIVNYQNGTAFGANSAITVANGATAQIQGGITSTGVTALTISGSGASGATGALENVSGANSATMPVVLGGNSTISSDAGSLTLSGSVTGAYNLALASQSSGNGTITLSGTVNNAGAVTNNGAGNGTTTISALIGTNVTGVVENSANSGLTLSGANTYTAGTTVTSGTISIGANNNLGATTATLLLNGGTLKITATIAGASFTHVITAGPNGGTFQVYNGGGSSDQLTLNTANQLLGSGTLTFIGGGTLIDGANFQSMAINNSNTFNGAIVIQNGGSLELNNNNAVGYGSTFTLNGSSELIVDSGITLADAINVNGGTLTFNNGSNAVYSGSITIGNSGMTAGLRNFFGSETGENGTIVGNISGTGGITLTNNANTLTLTGSNTYAGNTNLGTAASTLVDVEPVSRTYAGNISGSGAFTKSGPGILTLAGTESYTGATTVTNGGLVISGSATSTALTFNTSGGSVNYNEAAGTAQSMGALSFGGGDATVQSTYGGSGNTSLTFSSLAGRAAGATGNFVTSGGVNGTSNNIVITGSSGFISQGDFFGGTNYAWINSSGAYIRGINYGTANTAGSGDAGAFLSSGAASLSSTSYVEITGTLGAQNTATFITLDDTGSNNVTLASTQTLTVNGLLETGGSSNFSGGAGIEAASGGELVIRTNAGSDAVTISTPILNNSASSLTKSGAGTLTLTAANTYTGNTYVDGGTLALSAGSLTGNAGSLFVNAGATFTSSGASSFNTIVNMNGGNFTVTSGTLTDNYNANNNILIGGVNALATFSVAAGATFTDNPGTDFIKIGNNTNSVGILNNAGTVNDASNGGNLGAAQGAQGVIYNSGTFNQLGAVSGSHGIYAGNSADTYGYIYNTGVINITSLLGLNRSDTNGAAPGSAVVDVAGGAINIGTQTSGNGQGLLINSDPAGWQSLGTAQLNITGSGNITVGATQQGVVTINNTTNSYSSVNVSGAAAIFNLTGTSGVNLNGSSFATNVSTLSLANGGAIDSSFVQNTGSALSTGVFSFNGGTLVATATNASGLIQSGVTALVESGSNTINNGGFNVTVAAALLGATGSGLTGITLTGGTAGFIGAPVVVISGGGGAGAAAIANFNPSTGTLTGFTITSSGTGYTSAPTIELYGGSGVIGAGASPDTGVTATASIGAITTGSLTFSGTGTTTLSSVNSYSDPTYVNAGTLSLTGTLNGGTTINNNSLFSETSTGSVGGAASVVNASGTTTLAGVNTYSGASNVTGGILSLTGTIGGSAITNAATFTESSAGAITGASSVTNSAGTTTLGGINYYTGATNVNGGTLSITGTIGAGSTGSAITNAATVNESASGVITGSSSFANTAGTATMAGLNNYSGSTNVTGGTLNVTGTYSGAGATTVSSGGTLVGTGVIDGPVTIAGGASAAAAGSISMLNVSGGTLTLGDGVTLGSITSGSSAILNLAEGGLVPNLLQLGAGALIVNAGGAVINITSLGIQANQTYNLIDFGSGPAAGSGSSVDGLSLGTLPSIFGVSGYSLNVSSTAVQLTTTGASAPSTAYWSGTVGGNAGTLASQWTGNNGTIGNFTADSAGTNPVGALPAAATNVIFSGANAGNFTNTLGQNFTINSLTFTGSNGSNAVTIANDGSVLTVGAGGVLVQSGAGPVTLGVNLAGVGTVTANSADLALLGTNSYTGGTVINSGTVQVNSSTSLGVSGTVAMAAGTTLEALNAASTVNNFTLSGDPTIQVDSGVYTITGILADGASSGTLEKSGAGTLTLVAAETYTGATKINAGTLQLGNGTVDGYLVNTSGVVDNGALVYDAVLTDTASYVISGSGSLAMSGTGTLILTGSNTYGGATTVSAGTLQAGNGSTGSLSGASATVAGGALLVFDEAGGGSYSGNISDAGAVVGAEGAGITTLGGAISGTGRFTQSGAGTTTLAGANTYTGATAVSNGTLNLTGSLAGSSVTTSGAAVFTEASTGAVSGTGASFTQASTGASTLAGSNTYGGATAISAGSLNLTGTLAGSGVLTSGAGVFTEASTGVISGTGGSFTQGSTGISTLAGANTYSGATTVNSGALAFKGAAAVSGSSVLTVNNGGALTLLSDVGATFTPGSVSGTGNTVFNGAANTINVANISTGVNQTLILGGTTEFFNTDVLTVNGSNGYSLTLNAVAFQTSGATQTFNPSAGVTLNIGAITGGLFGAGQVYGVINLTGSGTTNLTGAITQSTSNRSLAMTLNQTGTVVISGNNNFRNNNNASDNANTYVNVNSGTTDFNSNNAIFSNNALIFNINGGTIDNTSGSPVTLSFNGTTNIGGNFAFGGTRNLSLGTNAVSLGGSYTITTSGSAALTIGGAIASSTSSLTEAGSGTLNLSGANLYTGATSVTGGTLVLGNSLALQDSTLIYNNLGGTISFGTLTAATLGGLSGAQNLPTGSLTALTLNNQAGATGTYSGTIANGGANMSLTESGPGTQILSGTNTYTGSTTISAGTLVIGGAGDLNSGTYAGNISDSGTFIYNSSVAQTLSGAISGSGAVIESGPGTLALTSSNSYKGGTAISGGILNFVPNALGTGTITFGGGILQYAAGNTQDVSGQIGASGGAVAIDTGANTVIFNSGLGSGDTGGLAKYGAGVLDLTASNSYSGGTVINAGTVQINTVYSMGNPAGNATINNGGTLDVLGGNTIATSRSFAISGTGTVQVDNGSTYTVNGGIADGANAGTLNVTGSGTLNVAGAVTTTNGTKVNGGTLIVSGGLSGNATVNSGGTLGGGGTTGDGSGDTIGGNVSVATGGNLFPGATSGTNTNMGIGGNLTLADSAKITVNLTGAGTDLITVNGSLTLAADAGSLDTLTVNLLSNPLTGSPYYFLVAGNGNGGNFATAALLTGSDASLYTATVAYDSSEDAYDVTFAAAAIPEPGTWGMLLSGVGMLIALQHARRRKH